MTEEEIRALREQLTAVVRRVRREQVPVDGVSQSAIRVLHATDRLETPQPARLAAETRMAPSNIAAALRELQAAGLVERRGDDDDRRRVHVHLTARGAELVAATRGARDTWLAHAVDAELDAEEQQVLRDAGRLLQRLADHPGSVAG